MDNKLSVKERLKAWTRRLGSERTGMGCTDNVENTPIDLTGDYIAGRDIVRDRITARLGQLVKRRRMAADKALVIYMDDTYNYQQAVAYALADYIGTYIEANTEWQFLQYFVRLGKPEMNDVAVPIAPGMAIALRLPVNVQERITQGTSEIHNVNYPAVIKVLDGHGSMLEEEVVLMPIDGRTYNIGIGKVMVVDSSVRYNDIPISDDVHDPMFRYNRFVSRKHAKIVYRAGKGYYLYSQERGTPAYSKRTEISSASGVKRLDSPRTGQMLHDGDSIVLNHNVILTFNEQKPEHNTNH